MSLDFRQLSLQEISNYLEKGITEEEICRLNEDKRKSVKQLLQRYEKKMAKENAEIKRLSGLYCYEEKYYKKGYQYVAGTDEVGRGPVAGPVTVAAVILPLYWHCSGLNDSKKIAVKKREEICKKIKAEAIAYEIVSITAADIDRINIYEATKHAMQLAINKLQPAAQAVLTDAMPLSIDISYEAIIKGDAKSASVAAASILAKVARDDLMTKYDKLYPEYGFAKHKGYLTEQHSTALEKYGYTPIHRRSFAPISSMLFKNQDYFFIN